MMQTLWPLRRSFASGLIAVALAGSPGGAAGEAAGPATSATLKEVSATLAARYPTLRALVVARGGCVVAEYYRKGVNAQTRSPVYSVTKSVLSILVGIAIDRGLLALDRKLSEILPEAFDRSVDSMARSITIRDLLTMTAGFDPAHGEGYGSRTGVPADAPWRWMLDRPMKDPPGDHFHYDGPAADLLAIALSRAIGQDAGRFAKQNLFDPLGIKTYTWVADAGGQLIGESDLYLTARDMAKIGVLVLRRGRWGRRRIVSDAYIADATTKHSDGGPPIDAAYGYLWWINKTRANLDAFFAAGIRSQLIYVVPKRDLVVAVAAETIPGGGQSFLDDVILPAEAATPSAAPCLARWSEDGRE